MPTWTNFRSSIGYCYTVLNILTPIVLSIHYPWDRFQETSRPICDSPQCTQMSHDLLYSMRQTVDPCDDFYEYVCGSWENHRDLEPYMGYLDLETILQYNAYKKLRSILEQPIKRDEAQDTTKAKLLFQQCMRLPYLERVDESVLRQHMKSHGFWTTSARYKKNMEPWWTIHNYYLSISGDSAFFNIDLYMPEDGDKPELRLQRTSSPYGTIYHKYQWEVEERQIYFTFLEKVFQAVTGSGESSFPLESLRDDLRDVFNFRQSLQKVGISKVDPSISTAMKISELAQWYTETGCPKNSLGNINWLELFRSLFKNNKDVVITEDTIVHVHSMDYLNGLCNLLLHTRQKTILNHMHLHFMERHITLKPNLKKLLFFAITRGLTPTGKIRYIKQQWYSCIQNHNMQDFLGLIYSKFCLTPSIMKETAYIISDLKEIMESQIDAVKWMGDSESKGTKEKIKEIRFVIGYPGKEDWRLHPNVTARMIKNSVVPSAFYNARQNVIYISSLYFQPPVYDNNLPFSVTYATLGSLIAHEMYHMFDYESVNSGMLHSIWGRKQGKHHKENSECFVDYYSKQPIKELRYKTYEKARLNSRLTRDENIADVMGLKAAFNAYKKVVWGRQGICPTLPRFESIPCDRMFFIAYARTFCSHIPEEMFIRRLSQGTHSPNRLRVNGPVSNMKEFARAFKCDLGKPMNPAEKCDLWN